MAGTRKIPLVSILGLSLWSALVVAGFVLLLNYSFAPGAAEPAPSDWPAASAIERAPDRPALLMFLHPHCPCSSASVEEFDRILAHAGREVAATVLFVKPPGAGAGWERTELFDAALRIPGVALFVDEGGAESRRFQARTSGAVLLYDAGGRLLFSGGITGSRGHAGANAGRAAVLATLSGDGAASAAAPVYGCPLETPAEGGDEPAWAE